MAESGNVGLQQGRLRLGCLAFGARLHHLRLAAQAPAPRLLRQSFRLAQGAQVVMGDGQAHLRGAQPRVAGHQLGDQAHPQRPMVIGQRLDIRIGRFDRPARAAKQIQLLARIEAGLPRARLTAGQLTERLAAAPGLARRAHPEHRQGR